MTRIKYDINLMKYISIFENLTRSKVKDCIDDEDTLIFVVKENEASRAIGKGGANVKKLMLILKKKIKVVEFNDDPREFIKNFIHPAKAEVREEGEDLIIEAEDKKTKGFLIGRGNQNLKKLKSIVKRYFKVNEIKVA